MAGACGPIAGVGLTEALPAADSSSSSFGTYDGSTGEPRCTLPTLDDLTLGQVYIDPGPFSDIARGTSRQLQLASMVAGFFEPVMACVTWSIEPTLGATINDNGLVFVAAGTAVGSSYVVTADIENGRRVIDLGVAVYEPIVTPILGFWSESTRTACDGTEFLPGNPVGELLFLDNAEFRVTWTPFEAYVDYWGVFSHAPDSGALVLTLQGGNVTPTDLDPVGMATIADGALVLTDMFLGTAPGDNPMLACGHRFE